MACTSPTTSKTVTTPAAMGLYQTVFGSDGTSLNFSMKKKFQWVFAIPNITVGSVEAQPLPCIKASRPKLNFREMNAEHLNETVYFPSKPDWQNIQISVYDRVMDSGYLNPIFTWLKLQYDPKQCSQWYPCIDPLSFKPCATLTLLNGCGEITEQWILEHIYPVNMDWGELDMSQSEVITVDMTLRYDRAWQEVGYDGSTDHLLYGNSDTCCTICNCESCDGTGCNSICPSSSPQSSSGSSSSSSSGGTGSTQQTYGLSPNGTAMVSGGMLTISFPSTGSTEGDTAALSGYLSQMQATLGSQGTTVSTQSGSGGVTSGVFSQTYSTSKPLTSALEPDFVMF